MEELPHKLKIELSMAIHKKMYANVKFFKEKETQKDKSFLAKSFLAWVGTVIRPINV